MYKNYFTDLLQLDLSQFSSEKNGLLYIQWSRSWSALKSAYPKSFMTIYESPEGNPYFTDGKTCWVKVGVTVVFDDGTNLEHIEYLAVMDHRNQSIKKEAVTSTNVINSLQRCATKAIARHGIGLSVYYGEEISAELNEIRTEEKKELKKAQQEINTLGQQLIAGKSASKEQLYAVIKKYNNDDPHTNTIGDLESCRQILAELQAFRRAETQTAEAESAESTEAKPKAAAKPKARGNVKVAVAAAAEDNSTEED